MNNMNYLEVKQIQKNWPDLKISADFSLEAGKMLALTGHSGSGKSTVLRLISGLEKPDSGQIIINGTDCTNIHPSKRGIGMVFQQTALFPHLNVLKNIMYGLDNQNLSKSVKYNKAEKILSLLNLSGFENRNIQTLSGGESQRVSLARTLIMEPALILFDEPFSSLDQALKIQLREEIKSLQKELNFTGIFVTHDLEEACFISDYMGIMKKGEILTLNKTEEVFLKPNNTEILNFLKNGFIISASENQLKKPEKNNGEQACRKQFIVLSTGFISCTEFLKTDKKKLKLFLENDGIISGKDSFEIYSRCKRKEFSGFSNKITFAKDNEEFELNLPVSAEIDAEKEYILSFDINSVKEI